MKSLSVFLLTLLVSLILFAQKKESNTVRLNGYIFDSNSKETLIGSAIYNPKTFGGTTSNNYGFYSLILPKGENTLAVSYVGYQKQTLTLNILKDTTINIFMQASCTLKEIIITDKSAEKNLFNKQI